MQRNLRGYVLGSFLMGAMGFAACSSDDEGDDYGVGGSDVGGAAGATTKASTTGKVGGAGPTGGTTAKGGAGGATSGPTSSSAQGGSTLPGSSATGGSTTTSTVAAGAPGNGGSSAQGGSSQAAGSPATGGVAPTGGTTAAGGMTGVAGNAGNAGADPGVAGAAGASSTTPPPVWPFDAADGWGIRDTGNGWTLIDGTAGAATFSVANGVATWAINFESAGADTASQNTMLQKYVTADFTGKTVTIRMRWASGANGPGGGAGFTISGIAVDNTGYTNAQVELGTLTSWSTPSAIGADFKDFNFVMPAPGAVENFDPAGVIALQILVQSMGSGGTFDYTTHTFEIDSITY